MVLTEQEHQLIECIRRLKDPDEFSVTVSRGNGARQDESPRRRCHFQRRMG